MMPWPMLSGEVSDYPPLAEWEHAARGGLIGKRYSWADAESVARK